MHNNPITCVHFNTFHPAMFASSDSSGNVHIINMYKNFDKPVWINNFGSIVFNAKWDKSGKFLAISDDQGSVFVNRFKNEFFDYKPEDRRILDTTLGSSF